MVFVMFGEWYWSQADTIHQTSQNYGKLASSRVNVPLIQYLCNCDRREAAFHTVCYGTREHDTITQSTVLPPFRVDYKN